MSTKALLERRYAQPRLAAEALRSLEHILRCAHAKMDELGYPPVNRPVIPPPAKEKQ
jgi:hypothetical protein